MLEPLSLVDGSLHPEVGGTRHSNKNGSTTDSSAILSVSRHSLGRQDPVDVERPSWRGRAFRTTWRCVSSLAHHHRARVRGNPSGPGATGTQQVCNHPPKRRGTPARSTGAAADRSRCRPYLPRGYRGHSASRWYNRPRCPLERVSWPPRWALSCSRTGTTETGNPSTPRSCRRSRRTRRRTRENCRWSCR